MWVTHGVSELVLQRTLPRKVQRHKLRAGARRSQAPPPRAVEEYIGLEEIHDGLWNIVYYDTLLGRFNEHTHTITGAPSLKGKC